MKKYILPLFLITAIIFGCNSVTNFITQYLNAGNLSEQNFIIQTDKNTTIKTAEGSIISIPANSIKADGNTVTLQVKEALTMAEILKAGLTTQSGKDILSSDGMFYIGTKEQSTITGAIHIKLPTANANKNMQLYKGVEKGGKIDWQSPKPIAKTLTPLVDSGEVLFKSNCTSCHAIDKELTGTALAWMDKRRSKEWLHAFIQNNQKVLASGDGYANCVYCKYKSSMTVFPNLTNRDIDLMCKYIDKVSKEKGIPENFNPNSDCDSCDFYRVYFNDLENKKDSLVKNNAGAGQLNYTVPTVTNTPNFDSLEFVRIPEYDVEYYQFDIATYGWYNIDLLWKNMHGEVESSLIVKIKGEYKERIKVYLVIPSLKVLTEGGYLKGSTDFGFDRADGTMPLPQNTVAFIVALSEQNEKLYFVKQRFITSTNQTIEISLKETDKQTVTKLFAAFQPDSVKIEVNKTKNFAQLKEVDSTLTTLKKRLSHCGCGEAIISLPSKYATFGVDTIRKAKL